MVFYAFLAVFCGAGFGASIRWLLGLALNPIFPTVPLGTLAANLLGGYLIGAAIGYVAVNASISSELRLFVITGFMGGLTTFSTFSAEVINTLARGQVAWSLAVIAAHLFGSLLLTALGILTVRGLLS